MAGTENPNGAGESTVEVLDVDKVLGFAAKILRSYGDPDTADLAERKVAGTDISRQVVVVGEVKRGKSSLVNALLGHRDASPVDVDIATSATLHFVPSSEQHPAGAVDLMFPGSMSRIDRADLPDWVTVHGRHVSDPNVEALPTRAVISVDTDAMADTIVIDTVVVDTPGTGGLDPHHARLAMQSAESAGVLLVVCDASTPLTAPEMDFIRTASASVESIIVACTKTDKNLRRWKPIVAENRRLLAMHLKRTVPVIGVSSVRALAAYDLPAGPARDTALAASGITELRRLIQRRMAMGGAYASADGLRTAREGLRKVQATITSDLAVQQQGTKALPQLEAQQAQLKELREQSQQWQHYLGRDMTAARQDALTYLDDELERIRQDWTNRINKNGLAVLRKNPQVFTADMETELLTAMSSAVEVFLNRLRAIVDPLFDSEVVWTEIREQTLASMQTGKLTTTEVGSKRTNLIDPSVMSMATIGTSMLGALLGIGAIAGVVWISVNLGYRAMRTGKQNLIMWLRETLQTVKVASSRMLETGMATSRPEIVVRYTQQLTKTNERVQQQIKDANDAAKLDATERDTALKRLQTNQRYVAQASTQIDTLIKQLTEAAGDN